MTAMSSLRRATEDAAGTRDGNAVGSRCGQHTDSDIWKEERQLEQHLISSQAPKSNNPRALLHSEKKSRPEVPTDHEKSYPEAACIW